MDHPIKIPQETEDELKNELLIRKLETNKIKYEVVVTKNNWKMKRSSYFLKKWMIQWKMSRGIKITPRRNWKSEKNEVYMSDENELLQKTAFIVGKCNSDPIT